MCKRFPPSCWRHTAGIRRAERERKKGGRNIKSKRGNEYINDLNLLVLWNPKRDNKHWKKCVNSFLDLVLTDLFSIRCFTGVETWLWLVSTKLETWRGPVFTDSNVNWELYEKICFWTFHWWLALRKLDLDLPSWTLELYRFLLKQDLRPGLYWLGLDWLEIWNWFWQKT